MLAARRNHNPQRRDDSKSYSGDCFKSEPTGTRGRAGDLPAERHNASGAHRWVSIELGPLAVTPNPNVPGATLLGNPTDFITVVYADTSIQDAVNNTLDSFRRTWCRAQALQPIRAAAERLRQTAAR